MFQRLLSAACILLTVASLDGKPPPHKKYDVVREGKPIVCEDDRVKCRHSDSCIPHRWICDGFNDCGDHSDESECPFLSCSIGQIKCANSNGCIPASYMCDGLNDCGDNSDEPEECRSRACPVGQLQCKNGQCIGFNAYCTGSVGCRDDTQFTDVICPPITCDPGYVKCALKTKCIPSNFVCDGDDDCGDFTDEPDNCRTRSCESDFFKCDNGQCFNRTVLCTSLSYFTYGCRDDTDMSRLCIDVTCPTGYYKCVSDGKCTSNSNLCNGSPDCADGSDEARHHCTGPIQCTHAVIAMSTVLTAPCPGTRRCISRLYFCDLDDDCGDNSDEDESFCRTRTCEPNEVRCGNGQCIDKVSLCDGSYSCLDRSFSDDSLICSK